MNNYVLADEEVMQELSDKEWMKGVLLKAADLALEQDFDGSKYYLDMLVGMLGLTFHNDVVRYVKAKQKEKEELAMDIVNLMLGRIEHAFKSFKNFSDYRYPKYLGGKLLLAQNNLNSDKPTMESAAIVEAVGKRLETIRDFVKVSR